MGRIKSTPAPSGDKKKRLLFHQRLSSFSVFIFSFFPSLAPLAHSRLSFQRQKQSLLFSQKGGGGGFVSLFSREHERLKWSQYADIGLNSGYGSALYSLFLRHRVHMHVCLCVSHSVLVHAVLIDGYWIGYYSLNVDIVQERQSMISYFRARGRKDNFMYCMRIPTPVMELVNTGYALSCTSLPHSSVTHSTALSACSARREAPAGLH